MEARVRFAHGQILEGDCPGLMLGGEFQYFRIRRPLWEGGLRSLKEAGVNLISTYVPWIWHETEEGSFDFAGETLPERDLVGFLALCHDLGLPVALKPGPYIYAEYQGFGIPLWLRERYPELRMQVAGVAVYSEISLNHPEFLVRVERWFAALAPFLRAPVERGEVVALQLDNETGMPQFGQGPYLVDRNPEAVARLRRHLAARHGDIAALNAAWGTNWRDFEGLEPPEGPPYSFTQLVDLAKFVEDDLVAYLRTLREMWKALGIETHFYLNDIWIPAWPNHFGKKNQVAPVGYDPYPKFIRIRTALDQPYTISYLPKLFASFLGGGPLLAPEIGCGWLDEKVTVPPPATWQEVLASYLHGCFGTILYPIHDGVDPDARAYVFHAALDAAGRPSERMAVVRALGQFRLEWAPLLTQSRELLSPVGILHYQEGTYDALQYMVDPLDSARHHMDDAIDRYVTLMAGGSGLLGALSEAGYAPRVLDLDRASAKDLASCRVLFFPCNGRLIPELAEKLAGYVRAGGHLITIGAPFVHDALFPTRIKRTWRPQSLSVVAGTFADLFMFHIVERRKIAHPLVRFTIEKLQPVMGIVKFATRSGTWLCDSRGERVWASRFVSYVQLPPGATEKLNYLKAPVAYSMPVGEGTSSLVGTLLGPPFDSPGYYLDDARRLRSVSRFLGDWLGELGVAPLLPVPPGIEVVIRELPDGGRILGIFNRGRATAFELPDGGGAIARQIGYRGSTARREGPSLAVRMAEADVLVLHQARGPDQ